MTSQERIRNSRVNKVQREVNKKQPTRKVQEECCVAVERGGETPVRLVYRRSIHTSIKKMAAKNNK
jgi:hypothetical protein